MAEPLRCPWSFSSLPHINHHQPGHPIHARNTAKCHWPLSTPLYFPPHGLIHYLRDVIASFFFFFSFQTSVMSEVLEWLTTAILPAPVLTFLAPSTISLLTKGRRYLRIPGVLQCLATPTKMNSSRDVPVLLSGGLIQRSTLGKAAIFIGPCFHKIIS